MKLLVLGASGMAGGTVTMYLREHGHTVDTIAHRNKFDKDTHNIDVSDKKALDKVLGASKYNAVINCTGVLVGDSEAFKDRAVSINALLPHYLESYFQDSPTKVVHISTDGVFSGKQGPYKLNAVHDGQSFYGRSKSLGEINNGKDITFRTSIIGPDRSREGSGLLNWALTQSGEVSGFTNKIWNGVTTLELAKLMEAAITQNASGIVQAVPEESISKYDLLVLIRDTFGKHDLKINKLLADQSVDYSLVTNQAGLEYDVKPYGKMLEELYAWVMQHKKDFPHYV